jgi:hypothetical protein
MRALLIMIRGLDKPAPRKYQILRLHSQALLAALLDGAEAPVLLAEALKQAVSQSETAEAGEMR